MKRLFLLLPLLAFLACGTADKSDSPILTVEGGQIQGVRFTTA